MKTLPARLGKRIRQLRMKKGWSQEELADKCGLHRTYVGSVERGERNTTLESMSMFSKTLGVKLVDLVRGIDD